MLRSLFTRIKFIINIRIISTIIVNRSIKEILFILIKTSISKSYRYYRYLVRLRLVLIRTFNNKTYTLLVNYSSLVILTKLEILIN